ncbi:hypothetical protein ACVIQY_006137 [Bradyrhizobium sp. USDA 3051]
MGLELPAERAPVVPMRWNRELRTAVAGEALRRRAEIVPGRAVDCRERVDAGDVVPVGRGGRRSIQSRDAGLVGRQCARHARRLGPGKAIAQGLIIRSTGRICRCRRPFQWPDGGGASGQPPHAAAGARTQPGSAQTERSRQVHGRRARRHHDLSPNAGRVVHGRDRRAAPAALAAADIADLSALPHRLAGHPHRRADHLPDRRYHRPAGILPFPQVRRGAPTPSTWSASWCCASSAC